MDAGIQEKLFGGVGMKENNEIAEVIKQIQQEAVEKYKKEHGWISCSDQMPEEHDSIFAKFKGTDKWKNSMFERTSKDVNITIKFKSGERMVRTAHTIDGEWSCGTIRIHQDAEVIAWMPFPEPYQEKQ